MKYDLIVAANERIQINLLDGEFYVNSPYETFAWMRENEPIYWDDTNKLWGISRYDDIVAIERDKNRFISSDTTKGGYRPNIPADQSIIGLDDPDHVVRRNLVSRRFTPKAVLTWEDHIRETVVDLLDAVADSDKVEVISQLAAPLPAQMIGLFLGFPDEMWPKLAEWSEKSIALGGGPEYMNDEGITAVFEFAGACSHLYESKKECPADDVMSQWIDTEREGLGSLPFSLDQIISDCLLLLDGGAETTRTVIARTLVELAKDEDIWNDLKQSSDLSTAVEEFIRFVTPIHNMCRVATENVQIDGVTIKEGDQVVLMYSSANRDPSHFDDPEILKVNRTPNHHLSFGHGTHFCLGASLARLEIKIFFEEFLNRFKNLSLDMSEPPVEMPNSFVYGLKEAHIFLEKV
ncbi:MAG: cytochrome P450 [Actinomycetota bacterium]|nr:cytochrome P450 [Actinomycetota bacterium]